MKADLVVTNARVLTMDASLPRAGTVAIADGRIVALEDIGGAAVIDAKGGTVLPGFVESHVHAFMGGAEIAHLQLGGVMGDAAVGAAVRAYAEAHPQGVLMAEGADYRLFGHPTTRADLDRMSPDRPLAITAADHHTVWANTAALEAAGLLHGVATDAGSEVVMGADGLATGELREPGAFTPILLLGDDARATLGLRTGGEPDPAPTPAERAADRATLRRGLGHLAAQGVTTAVNMDGNLYTIELLEALADADDLPVRMVVPFHFKPHMGLGDLDRAAAMRERCQASRHADRIGSGFVKMFMDGVIDSGTAYMLDGSGTAPLFAADRFAEIATAADARGLQIAVHAIGDGAVRATIDGYAAARAANGPRDSRHRIEHIELIDPADAPRLAALGIVASVQPVHAPGALDFPLEPTASHIGRARWADAYRARTLAALGVPLAFASDWPVADASVLRGIGAATTRRPLGEGLPEERVGLMAALAAYTTGGAFACHRDGTVGRIAPGLAGDLVVLDADIEAVPLAEIGRIGVAATVLAGRITYQA